VTEPELIRDLVNAIQGARYGDAKKLERVRALLNCYVSTAIQAMTARIYHDNVGAQCQIAWPADPANANGPIHRCGLPHSHVSAGIPHRCGMGDAEISNDELIARINERVGFEAPAE
jgi:hypothetical protein